jgi:hypothetical protein
VVLETPTRAQDGIQGYAVAIKWGAPTTAWDVRSTKEEGMQGCVVVLGATKQRTGRDARGARTVEQNGTGYGWLRVTSSVSLAVSLAVSAVVVAPLFEILCIASTTQY